VGTYYNSSGVLVSAAINTPRFDYDPVTLQLKGLLLEDQSANIMAPSIPVGGAWSPSALTVTAASGIAPDGTNTMVRFAETAANSLHFTAVGQSFAGGGQWTGSVYAKAAELRYLQFVMDDGGANAVYATFDLTGGTITGPVASTGTAVAVSASMQAVGNGIYRCSIVTTPAGTALRTMLFTANAGNPGKFPSYAGNAANGLLVWGAQVEALPYMTSHIPTTSVSVTRARDSLFYPGTAMTGFLPSGAGSWFGEFISMIPAPNSPRIIANPSPGSRTPIYVNSARQAGQFDGSAITTTANTLNANTIAKAASTWTPTTGKVCLNGDVIVSAAMTTGYDIFAASGFNVFLNGSATENMSGWARRISYWPRTLSDSEMQAATTLAGPTLSLDFMQPGALDSRITFTRASTATYTDASGVIQTAATNAPRWDYAGGVLRGLLIEEQRTNLALNSGNPSAADWHINGAVTKTNNQATAPDGTTTACRLDYTGGLPEQLAFWVNPGANVVSFSIWMRGVAGGEQQYLMATPDGALYYRTLVTLTTSWQRFTLTTPALTNTTWFFQVGVDNRDASQSFKPARSVYAWGAQVEQGAFPTSYIPTTSVSVTRAADVASMPTNVSWFNKDAYTIQEEFFGPPVGFPGGAFAGVSTSAGDVYHYLALDAGTGTSWVYSGAGGIGAGPPFVRGIVKIAATFTPARMSLTAMGSVPVVNATGFPPLPTMGRIAFGNDPWSLTTAFSSHVRGFKVWNRALSDTEMQQVTT